jgi:hypothetical protein
MLSPQQLQAYRSMSPEERWRITEELMTLAWRSLMELPDVDRERRLALVRAEHDAGSQALLEALRSRT